MQEEFEHMGILLGESFFEAVDVVVARLPKVTEALFARFPRKQLAVEKFRVHPYHKHLLVIRSIENRDRAGRRQHPHRSPEKMVQPFFLCGCFKAVYIDTLRVYTGHHMFDRAVLPRCIERLKDNNQRMLLTGPEYVLYPREL